MATPLRRGCLDAPLDEPFAFEAVKGLVERAPIHPPAGAAVELLENGQRERVVSRLESGEEHHLFELTQKGGFHALLAHEDNVTIDVYFVNFDSWMVLFVWNLDNYVG